MTTDYQEPADEWEVKGVGKDLKVHTYIATKLYKLVHIKH